MRDFLPNDDPVCFVSDIDGEFANEFDSKVEGDGVV